VTSPTTGTAAGAASSRGGGLLDPERGFLPRPDPLAVLPDRFAAWEEVAAELPKLLAQQQARRALAAMPVLDTAALDGDPELRRAMLLLSYLGHAWVWQGPEASTRLPPSVAVPWHGVAARLGRPPVLSYASYALDNWRRLDPGGPIALGNLALLQNFLGGIDEEWFILVHVEIEARAAPALDAIPRAQAAAAAESLPQLESELGVIGESLEAMVAVLTRMPEGCDPYIYYRRVRPYIHGWKDHPGLEGGVVYEGVEEYAGVGQRFRGETGAQSAIVPALDAVLGVEHRDDPLRPYLLEMRDYMTPEQRAFLAAVEAGTSVRRFLREHARGDVEAVDLYDRSVVALAAFRGQHLEYADRYIHRQVPSGPDNPTDRGTAGTPFMAYLRKHLDETLAHRLA
jgi:indoleamine 2,3-dioxygenase